MLSAEVRRKSPASPAESLREVAHSLALGELPALGELGTEGVWTFGYGSNMNMQALRSKKKIRVFEEAAATVVLQWGPATVDADATRATQRHHSDDAMGEAGERFRKLPNPKLGAMRWDCEPTHLWVAV